KEVYRIDVDPLSDHYLEVLPIAVAPPNNPSPTAGLRGLAISPNGKRLYVAAPSVDHLVGQASLSPGQRGSILVVGGVDSRNPGDIHLLEPIAAGPAPCAVKVTPDNVLLFTDAIDDQQGLSVDQVGDPL